MRFDTVIAQKTCRSLLRDWSFQMQVKGAVLYDGVDLADGHMNSILAVSIRVI